MPSSAREVLIGLDAPVRTARSACIGATVMVTTAAQQWFGAPTAIVAGSASTAKAQKRICDRVGGRASSLLSPARFDELGGDGKNEKQSADRPRRLRDDRMHELRCAGVHPFHL